MTANKAVIAAIIAGAGAVVTGLQVGDVNSAIDWIVIVLTAVIAGLGVYVTPNRPSTRG